jgi:predicted PurR-regulated permease PerM
MRVRKPQDRTFLILLIVVSLAFALILWPVYAAILWGIITAIVFVPVYRQLLRSMPNRRTLAAVLTVLIILVVVILPLALITVALLQEASSVYASIESGELNFTRYFEQVFEALPDWASNLLARFGLTNLGAVLQKLSLGLTAGSQFLTAQIINVGQNTVNFVISLFLMLYLLFFLLRDGNELLRRVREAIPLPAEQKRALFDKFTVVIRATVKGNIVVAIAQGALGGLIFWFLGIHAPLLWAVLMAFLSLVPAVGAGLVWLPVALFFLITGATWQGIVLIAYGVLVISVVDNLLRPILVGQDTKLPDYVVLFSTLGGISIFGINGFVLGPVIAAMFMAVWHIFSGNAANET